MGWICENVSEGLDRGDEGSGETCRSLAVLTEQRCPMRVASNAAVDPWQAANHFFVFLQALVLLGQLWGHDGQGVESQGNKSRGILEKQTQMDVSLPLPTFP